MFLLGAFLVGGTLGFTVDRVVNERLRDADSKTSMLDAFAAELELSATQRAAVDSIFRTRNRVYDSLMAPIRPQLRAARDSARREIAARLTEPQRRKFDEYIARSRMQHD
jgi:branched-subunit amino acid ABC-type transport system permease component